MRVASRSGGGHDDGAKTAIGANGPTRRTGLRRRPVRSADRRRRKRQAALARLHTCVCSRSACSPGWPFASTGAPRPHARGGDPTGSARGRRGRRGPSGRLRAGARRRLARPGSGTAPAPGHGSIQPANEPRRASADGPSRSRRERRTVTVPEVGTASTGVAPPRPHHRGIVGRPQHRLSASKQGGQGPRTHRRPSASARTARARCRSSGPSTMRSKIRGSNRSRKQRASCIAIARAPRRRAPTPRRPARFRRGGATPGPATSANGAGQRSRESLPKIHAWS
jgi:hypothetical protein